MGGWVKILLDYAPIVSLAAGLVPARSLTKEQKGRFRTLSSTDSTSQLDPNRRYRNEASMLGVLYPYAHIVPYAMGKQCSYIIYNTLWRGLAELLISLGKGNAKAR